MILAIDTASKTASVAIVEEGIVISEFSVLSEKTHSKAVLPMINSMFECAGKKIEDIEYIACSSGPGSFTGLRIGAAVAKGLSFSLSKQIVPVATLDALAYNALAENYIICPMIDARRNHVYTAFYKYEGHKLTRITDYMTVSITEALKTGAEFTKPLYFLGSGAEAYSDRLKEVKNGIIAPCHINMHRAGSLGVYAYVHFDALIPVYGYEFTPVYMSRSQAEEGNER